jgi:hypothetical protein
MKPDVARLIYYMMVSTVPSYHLEASGTLTTTSPERTRNYPFHDDRDVGSPTDAVACCVR